MHPVALITGASRGIGRGIAYALAAEATHDLVVNFAGNAAAAAECQAECLKLAAGKIRVAICQADVSSDPDRRRLVEFTVSELGRLDVLVNNAGIAPTVRADLLDAGEESFDRLINVNLKGPYFLSQLAARQMLANGPHPDFAPAIINITSISAYTASVNRGDYCVAKAGLAMMTKLYAARLAADRIGVFEVRPGVIQTDMTGPVTEKYDKLFADGLTPINRWGQPSDIGRAVAAIVRGSFPYSTGEVFNVDGGFHLHRL